MRKTQRSDTMSTHTPKAHGPQRRLFALLATATVGTTLVAGMWAGMPQASAESDAFYVSPTGNDASSGSAAAPWRTIGRAVRADSPVGAGDRVVVKAGQYNENTVTIEKSGITLEGEPGATLNYSGPSLSWFRTAALHVDGQRDVTVRGLNVDGKSSIWAGIQGTDVTNLQVLDNNVSNTLASGIIVLYGGEGAPGEAEVTSKNVKVLRNVLTNLSVGTQDQEALSIWGVDGFEVAYNTVTKGQREGIDAKVGSRNGSIHHNTVRGVGEWMAPNLGAGPAIYIDANRADSYNIDVYDNLIENNFQNAIAVATESVGQVRDVRIYNNVGRSNGIPSTPGAAVSICGRTSNVDVSNNTFFDHNNGFQVGECYGGRPTSIRFRNNLVIKSKSSAVFIDRIDSGVTISNNVFAGELGAYFQRSPLIDGTNQFVADAKVVSLPSNLRLAAGSPAIDAGVAVPFGSRDADGASRPQGTAPDVGAYEFGSATPPTTTPPTTRPPVTTGAVIANGALVSPWGQGSWGDAGVSSVNGAYRIDFTGPFAAAVIDPRQALDSSQATALEITYTAGDDVRLLAYGPAGEVGRFVVPGSGDGPRSFPIPWNRLGNPGQITGIAFQNDGSNSNQVELYNLTIVK